MTVLSSNELPTSPTIQTNHYRLEHGDTVGSTAVLNSPRSKSRGGQEHCQPWFYSQPSFNGDTEKPDLKLISSLLLHFVPPFPRSEMAAHRKAPSPPSSGSWGKQITADQMYPICPRSSNNVTKQQRGFLPSQGPLHHCQWTT